MSGVEFLTRAKAIHPHAVRIMLSAHADLNSVLHLVIEAAQ